MNERPTLVKACKSQDHSPHQLPSGRRDPPERAAASPVVVQALNSESGLCWESRFDAADVRTSDAFRYKAKTD